MSNDVTTVNDVTMIQQRHLISYRQQSQIVCNFLYPLTMPTHRESQKRKEGEDPPSPMTHPAKRTRTDDETVRDRCAKPIAHLEHI